MNKIAKILIEYGMDFEYECLGSQGEKIISYPASLEVTRQNGKVYFEYCGQNYNFEDNDSSFAEVARLTENACIEETT